VREALKIYNLPFPYFLGKRLFFGGFMFKSIIAFVVAIVCATTLFAGSITIESNIRSAGDESEIIRATVKVVGTEIGTYSDDEGIFKLQNIADDATVEITHVGFKKVSMKAAELKKLGTVVMEPVPSVAQTIVVEATMGDAKTPTSAYSFIERADIKETLIDQDVPEYLSYMPSTLFYTETGTALGYSYLNIRGFGQRRLSISINGVPQNDPEDHNVYWVDIPGVMENAELIQVQRGSGSGVAGYPAIGGTVNIITSPFTNEPKNEFTVSAGSNNYIKYDATFASGLINDKYSIYTKLSQAKTDGYRDETWGDYKSFFVSAARYDDKLTSQFNVYGGLIEDGLAYTGLPKDYITDSELRKKNYNWWEWDAENGLVAPWSTERRSDEKEYFFQPHIELLNEYKISENQKFNSTLFYVLGEGYFDYDGAWSVYYDDYFRLRNVFDSLSYSEPQNALIRAYVKNQQVGWTGRYSLDHKKGKFLAGVELRRHRSLHWGAIESADNLPVGMPLDYKYYEYKGGVDIFSAFVHENYKITDAISLMGEVQARGTKYQIYDEMYLGNEFSINHLFLNPKVALNYKFNDMANVFVSYARVSKEPRLKSYYDAAESSAGETPQFEVNEDGSYNYDNPVVKPETMDDIELGALFTNDLFDIHANAYYMSFTDEIVKSGQLDRFGQPITGNMDATLHAGIEAGLTFKPIKSVNFMMNATYGKNSITEGYSYLEYEDEVLKIDMKDNNVSGFPEFMMNAIARYNNKFMTAQVEMKYLGEFYSNNYGESFAGLNEQYPGLFDYSDNRIDPYFVANILLATEINSIPGLEKLRVFFKLNNIANTLYADYAEGENFFPGAERNFILGINLGF
jgi:iron complex outermembrane receptor protein